MKNNFFIIFYLLFYSTNLFADSLSIQAKNISIDKNMETTIFKDEVTVKSDKKLIKSDYVKYNKKLGYLLIKDNILATDDKDNSIQASNAEYFQESKILKTSGKTKIITSDKYVLEGSNITIDNKNDLIKSKENSILTDLDGNKIFLENFEYQTSENIFKSIGSVKINDNKKNSLEFSQIYIDTKKNEIIGSDIKAFLNDENFKISEKNKPRVFANNFNSNKKKSTFIKSVFTLCDYRENDKCPPWTIQSSKMLHDRKKKTIYYDNALIKVYDIPIFYIPKLSHPDPTVERRSGFLPPSISDTKNLGESISIPYFFDIAKNKNFTFTNRLYATENPLFLGEYHQALKDSFFMADFGFTEGYKNTSSTKKGGEKSHIFTKFVKNFKGRNNSDNSLSLSIQNTSNDKYLKLYKIKSNLVNYNADFLESSLKFLHQKENVFFSLDASVFETTKENYEDKYEFIVPEITFDKNLFNSEDFGSLDLQTNLKVRNYETNKLENFLVNDFDWESNEFNFKSGINSKILANFKNINYEAKNVSKFKEKTTNEFFGSLGLLADVNLKKIKGATEHFLTPKFLLKLSPGSMRKQEDDNRLTPLSAFNLNRIDDIRNYETGISSTVGFDYEIKKGDSNFDLSIAQVINNKENNKMADITSLNEKLSDLVGSSTYNVNKNFNINYDFSIDQSYQSLNYNEISTSLKFSPVDFNFGFLQEKKHLGNQEYFTTKIDLKNKENGLFSFETKRNLITNSAEFYNLSYEYLNDCLRAGLVFRREFYNDSELEPENSLLFKITLMPFGNLNSPTFSK